MKRNTILEIITILFMCLFFYTAINKFLVIPTLTHVLGSYPILGQFPRVAAWGIPLFELIIVAMLFLKRMAGLWLSMITMLGLSLYVAFMLVFHSKLPCTCGGLIQQLSWPQHLLLNICLLFLSMVGVLLNKYQHVQKEKNPIISNTSFS